MKRLSGFALLTALVVLLFLKNLRSTIIIAVAIPVSLLGAIAVMYFLGYTFNTMTMLGLLLLRRLLHLMLLHLGCCSYSCCICAAAFSAAAFWLQHLQQLHFWLQHFQMLHLGCCIYSCCI